MPKIENYIFSHIVEYYPWFSNGIDNTLRKKLTSCKPQFKADKAKAGDIALYQLPLDNDTLLFGRVEVVFDARLCTHEQILVIEKSEYIKNMIDPQLLRKKFTSYTNFIQQGYKVGDSLPSLEIPDIPVDIQSRINMIPGYFPNNADLNLFIYSLCSIATDSSQKMALEVENVAEAIEIMDYLFCLLPHELHSNISWLAGIYPESVRQFNFSLGIGTGHLPPLIDGTGNIKSTFSDMITRSAQLKDHSLALKYKHRYAQIYNIFKSFINSDELNKKTLEIFPDISSIWEIYRSQLDQIIHNNKNIDEALLFAKKAPKGLFDKDSYDIALNYIYERFLQKIQDSYRNNRSELLLAKVIIKSMKVIWVDKSGLRDLEKKIETVERQYIFQDFVLNKDVDKAIKTLPPEEAISALEDAFKKQSIRLEDLSQFFKTPEAQCDRYIKPDLHPCLWLEFCKYQQHQLISSIAKNGLKRDIVNQIIDLLQSSTGPVKDIPVDGVGKSNNSSVQRIENTREKKTAAQYQPIILELFEAVEKTLAFDAQDEMSILIDPVISKSSLFDIFLDSLLSLKSVLPAKQFEELLELYIQKLLSVMPKKHLMNPKKHESIFESADLYRVYFEILRGRLRKLNWSITSKRMEEVEGYLINKHGKPEVLSEGFKINQKITANNQDVLSIDQSIASPKKNNQSEQYLPADLDFWAKLRNDTVYFTNLLKEINPVQNSSTFRCFERMQFDCKLEMGLILKKTPDKSSLFLVIPYSLVFCETKVDPSIFINLVRTYINQVIKGMIDDPFKNNVYEAPFSFNFSPSELYNAYIMTLDEKINDLIHRVLRLQTDNIPFNQTNDILHIIIGNLAKLRKEELLNFQQ